MLIKKNTDTERWLNSQETLPCSIKCWLIKWETLQKFDRHNTFNQLNLNVDWLPGCTKKEEIWCCQLQFCDLLNYDRKWLCFLGQPWQRYKISVFRIANSAKVSPWVCLRRPFHVKWFRSRMQLMACGGHRINRVAA